MAPRQRARSELWLLIGWKSLVSLLVLAAGFRALSDDDYARVHIAQRFAESPAFDPSGSSWLPLPFWLTGSAMLALGNEPWVARVVSLGSGIGSTLLVWVAARWLGLSPRTALLGAGLAAAFPYSAWLGVATVPELLTASFIVLGLAALSDGRSMSRRGIGAVAVACAALCRYEAWPVVAVFVLFCVWDALRQRRPSWLAPAAIAAVGPAAWLVNGWQRHGHPFFFVRRVAAYHEAVGGDPRDPWQRLLDKPIALLRCEPELMGLCLLSLVVVLTLGLGGARLRRYSRVGLGLLALLLFLMVGDLRGAAPTHHEERALLGIWLGAAVLTADCLMLISKHLHASRRRLVAVGLTVTLLVGALMVRPWFARRDGFIDRGDAVAMGQLARRLEPRRTLLVSTPDYAFYSVFVGYGSPATSVPLDDRDPRRARVDPLHSTSQFRRHVDAVAATWVVVSTAQDAHTASEAGLTLEGRRGSVWLFAARR